MGSKITIVHLPRWALRHLEGKSLHPHGAINFARTARCRCESTGGLRRGFLVLQGSVQENLGLWLEAGN
jgi:hypothetical protein